MTTTVYYTGRLQITRMHVPFRELTVENEPALRQVPPAQVACSAFVEAFVFLLKVRDFKGSLGFAVLDFPWQRASVQPPPTNIGDWTEQLHLVRTRSGSVL